MLCFGQLKCMNPLETLKTGFNAQAVTIAGFTVHNSIKCLFQNKFQQWQLDVLLFSNEKSMHVIHTFLLAEICIQEELHHRQQVRILA